MIAIIDYGAGNLRSILRAIESQGGEATITGNPLEIVRADRVVLPGVGNAKAAMEQLISTGIADAVKEQVESGTPLLGVCLGMQLLFGPQEEGPTTGLSLIPGKAVRLNGDRKIPHMGWNMVRFTDHSPLTGRQPAHYYFVHSYVVMPDDPTDIAGITNYGQEFASVVIRDHIWGTQFHPEKSHSDGLDLIGAWLAS